MNQLVKRGKQERPEIQALTNEHSPLKLLRKER